MITGHLFFENETPAVFQQIMDAGQNFTGEEPSNLRSEGVYQNGGLFVPKDTVDNKGGLFDFRVQRKLRVYSIEYEMDSGATLTIYLVRADGSEAVLLSGATGAGFLKLAIGDRGGLLLKGEKIKATSAGASGVSDSKVTCMVSGLRP